MPATSTRTLIPGDPRERARIFRDAAARGRTVSVGYRKGGLLEVEDLTGCALTLIEHGAWLHFPEWPDGRMFVPFDAVIS